MKLAVKIVFFLLFCYTFSMNIFGQKIENIKSTGIKAAVIFPVGDFSDYYSTGFMVADVTKWYLSGNVRAVGRLELAFFGGKEISAIGYPGYTYTTNPIGIFTAGTGLEITFEPKSGFYGILEFPSMNIDMAQGTGFRVGLGIGFGYEFYLGKSMFGFEVRYNRYNALLIQNSEKSQIGLQFGLEAAF